jgi:phosphopantothenoylcysteine decarboxylase/phosphopantothenate--cysteine ligase
MPGTEPKPSLHFLITAGPTREYLDPIRFISNGSTGKMGYACAEAAIQKGHRVTLISGPVNLNAPPSANLIEVITGEQMAQATFAQFAQCDCLIMTAAVGDFRPKEIQKNKIKKNGQDLTLQLEPTTDILATLGRRKQHRVLIGFAVEDSDPQRHASDKMQRKNLDAIVLNSPAAIGADRSVAEILRPNEPTEKLALLSKKALAEHLVKLAENLLGK